MKINYTILALLLSNMSTRELNELKKELLSRGFSERSGGEA